MKAIELTQGQKDKLLEMCVKLFPKYEFRFCTHQLAKPISILNYKKTKDHVFNTQQIHWFEFCTTHLFEKIMINPNRYENTVDYISLNSSFTFGHPVDYLYEKFKKLK